MSLALFPYTLERTVTCAECGDAQPLDVLRVGVGERVPEPTMPHGWFVVKDLPYCQRHQVTIT